MLDTERDCIASLAAPEASSEALATPDRPDSRFRRFKSARISAADW
jgi:hypothetical protein